MCVWDRRQQDGVGDAVKQQRAAVITGETEEACRGPASSNKIGQQALVQTDSQQLPVLPDACTRWPRASAVASYSMRITQRYHVCIARCPSFTLHLTQHATWHLPWRLSCSAACSGPQQQQAHCSCHAGIPVRCGSEALYPAQRRHSQVHCTEARSVQRP
mgnify:CR=1 FL=1